MSDLRVVEARSAHLAAGAADRAGQRAREKRDRLVRQLRADDPERWSYGALAKALGCSRALVVKIVDGERAAARAEVADGLRSPASYRDD